MTGKPDVDSQLATTGQDAHRGAIPTRARNTENFTQDECAETGAVVSRGTNRRFFLFVSVLELHTGYYSLRKRSSNHVQES